MIWMMLRKDIQYSNKNYWVKERINIMKRIEDVLDKLSVKYDCHKYNNSDSWYGMVEFWTDTLGQDISVEFNFDGSAEDFVKQFCEHAENYDVDDEVELFIGMRGKPGVPNTVRELLNDCQEAKDTLINIADELKSAILGEEINT